MERVNLLGPLEKGGMKPKGKADRALSFGRDECRWTDGLHGGRQFLDGITGPGVTRHYNRTWGP